MAVEVVMPKQGNSVESCIIIDWKVKEGDVVAIGDVVCEAETDKSTIEVESTAEGTVLKLLYAVEEEVPVMQSIMIVGEPGEQVKADSKEEDVEKEEASETETPKAETAPREDAPSEKKPVPSGDTSTGHPVSPRARAAATAAGVDASSVEPTGPKGRVIERDIMSALEGREPLTPAAKAALVEQGLQAPEKGSGIGGRIRTEDLLEPAQKSGVVETVGDISFPGPVSEVAVKGIRKVTAKRMHASLAETAQFTMNAYADATSLQTLRARFKASAPELGLQKITIGDLVLFAVSRTVQQFPFMNSHFLGDTIRTFEHVHLGCAVDTPKGLLVPVIRYADQCSLKQLSDEFKRLASLSSEGKAQPDELSGGTFTVTNLGAMGIDTFTPVINVPEVAILGVGGISLRAIQDSDGDIQFVPHIGLSLTIDHQAVDGAPGARFLKALCDNIASLDLIMAL